MIMTHPKTIINFDAEDLEHVEYVRNLLDQLLEQIDDFREEGFDFYFDLADEKFTRETLESLDKIDDLLAQIR